MTDRFCVHCFENPEVKLWISRHPERGYCEFCGKDSVQTVDSELLCEALLACVQMEYSTPDEDGMSYITREGGWMGQTYEVDVPLDALGLVTDDESRIAPIEACLENYSWMWCDADHRNFNPSDRAISDWKQFSNLVKHRVRYMFLQEEREGLAETHGHSYHVREILREIGRAVYDAEMISTLSAGTVIYRVRPNPKGERYDTLAQLTGPPASRAVYANRMSPAGISMLYAALDKDTAMAETLDEPTRFSLAELRLSQDVAVVDFSKLPAQQSLLLGLTPESENTFFREHRHQIRFLHQFVHDLSKPIIKDRSNHIEYVPTQIVTEYFRYLYSREIDDTHGIAGIVYTSAQSANLGRNIVLFVDPEESTRITQGARDTSKFLTLENVTDFRVGDFKFDRDY